MRCQAAKLVSPVLWQFSHDKFNRLLTSMLANWLFCSHVKKEMFEVLGKIKLVKLLLLHERLPSAEQFVRFNVDKLLKLQSKSYKLVKPLTANALMLLLLHLKLERFVQVLTSKVVS